QKEEVIDELKEKISSLKEEKTVNKESIIKDTEKELESFKELSENRQKTKQKLENNSNSLVKEIPNDSDIFTDELPNNDDSSDTDTPSEIDSDAPIPKVQVKRSQYSMRLSNPSLDQCEKLISKLKDTNKSVILIHSSSDSTQFLVPIILERGTISQLNIYSSLLTRDDILSFSSQLSTNKSLTTLVLTTGSMSDDGIIALAQSLLHNEALENLHLNDNPGITSDSARSLAELLLINKKLQYLRLHHTSIDTDGVMMLMESLVTNDTLVKLWLDKQHEKTCFASPHYKAIESILYFL
uniref:Uncharacterized protein n=1 Tax=Amphimedon queenslandica TaxID=400682 RepID=A0A1X7UFP3_AMPQE